MIKRFTRASFPMLLVSALAPVAIAADAKPAPKPPATAPAPVVEVQADGSLLLKAEGARVLGYKLHLRFKPAPTLVYWVDPKESVEWPKAVKKGKYTAELTYSCAQNAGGNCILSAAASKLEGKIDPTGDWQTFKTLKLGTLIVANNETTVALRCGGALNHALMDVRSVKLTPVADEPVKNK